MINTEDLKGTIVSGENFILNQIGKIIPRDIVLPPEDIKKAGILYGIRRSGKSYILFDIFKKSKGDALYVDFEDERLEGFKAEDFESLKEAFFELKPHLINKRHTLFLFD